LSSFDFEILSPRLAFVEWTQLRTSEVGSAEVSSSERRTSQVCLTEVGTYQYSVDQPGSPQIDRSPGRPAGVLGILASLRQPAGGSGPGLARTGGLLTVLTFPGNYEADGDPYSNGTESSRECLGDDHASPLADGR
jgi:hypothetical protein